MSGTIHVSGVGSYGYEDGHYWREQPMLEVESLASGQIHKVPLCCDDEARALIAREYGFEVNRIEIRGNCWYDASDYNHFEFDVCGWPYAADNYGALTLREDLSWQDKVHPTVKPSRALASFQEMRAIVCERYGFEYGSIEIGRYSAYRSPEDCIIQFIVGPWAYQVVNLGELQLEDYDVVHRGCHCVDRKEQTVGKMVPHNLYKVYDGQLCSYRLLGVSYGELYLFNCWEEKDGFRRFTEVEGDPVQYMTLPKCTLPPDATLETVAVEMLELYESFMQGKFRQGFRVFEAQATPDDIMHGKVEPQYLGQKEGNGNE